MIVITTSDVSSELQQKLADKTQYPVVQSKILNLTEKEKMKTEMLITYGNFEDAITAEEIKQLPKLKWMHVLSSGTEQLPRDIIRDRGIHVTSSKGVHAIPMSEYVVGAILYFAKRIGEFRKLQQQMSWSYSLGMSEVHGKTLGILGTGFIGREIAKKAKALGLKVVGVNRSGSTFGEFDQIYKIDQLKEVISSFDFICGVLPSTEETESLIDIDVISCMKDGVIFINVGRGDLVVEEDLVKALESGKIGGAALDVFKEEPLGAGHPFWTMENVLVTPHASARTDQYMERAIQIFLENYRLFNDNTLQNLINKVTFDT